VKDDDMTVTNYRIALFILLTPSPKFETLSGLNSCTNSATGGSHAEHRHAVNPSLGARIAHPCAQRSANLSWLPPTSSLGCSDIKHSCLETHSAH